MLQDNIKKLEPLLAALAAVPWIDPGAEDGQRVPFIKTTVLDQVEGMGMTNHHTYVHVLFVHSGIQLALVSLSTPVGYRHKAGA